MQYKLGFTGTINSCNIFIYDSRILKTKKNRDVIPLLESSITPCFPCVISGERVADQGDQRSAPGAEAGPHADTRPRGRHQAEPEAREGRRLPRHLRRHA